MYRCESRVALAGVKARQDSWDVAVMLDDSLRRYGQRLRRNGRHDALRSRGRYTGVTPGVRWLSLQLLCQVPWSHRLGSLPLLTIACLSEKTCWQEGLRDRRLAQRSCLVWRLLRRWLAGHSIRVLADNFLSARLFRAAEQLGITLVKRFETGARSVKPAERAWYQQQSLVPLATGTALWYRDGVAPIARCFVITSDEAFKPALVIACHHQACSALARASLPLSLAL